MKAAPDDPARLARTARTMATLCAFFGPVIGLTTLVSLGLLKVIDVLEAQAGSASAIPTWFEPLVAFSQTSAPINGALGVLFTAVGIYAWRRPRRGLAPLRATAWIGTLAMVVLAVLWWRFGAAYGLAPHLIGAGVGAHAVQALLVGGAARFLGRRDVRDAVAAAAA